MNFPKICSIILCSLFVSALSFAQSSFLYVANNGSNIVSGISSTGIVSFFASVNAPVGVAVNQGAAYATNDGPGTVTKITFQGSSSTYATGLTRPQSLAFDQSGNLFVSSGGGIDEVSPGGGAATIFAPATDFGSGAFGVAFNSTGTLYVTGNGNTIYEVTTGGNVSTFVTIPGFTAANGLAFDSSGNLYVADYYADAVDEITPAGVVSTFVTGLNHPGFLAFDNAGNLYVTNIATSGANANTIFQVTPTGSVSSFASGLSQPEGLAFVPEPSAADWLPGIVAIGITLAIRRRGMSS